MGRQEVAAAISLFDANPDILICLAASISNAPPGEHKAVQSRILAYTEAISWAVVLRED
jgi:hypothetical protein